MNDYGGGIDNAGFINVEGSNTILAFSFFIEPNLMNTMI